MLFQKKFGETDAVASIIESRQCNQQKPGAKWDYEGAAHVQGAVHVPKGVSSLGLSLIQVENNKPVGTVQLVPERAPAYLGVLMTFGVSV